MKMFVLANGDFCVCAETKDEAITALRRTLGESMKETSILAILNSDWQVFESGKAFIRWTTSSDRSGQLQFSTSRDGENLLQKPDSTWLDSMREALRHAVLNWKTVNFREHNFGRDDTPMVFDPLEILGAIQRVHQHTLLKEMISGRSGQTRPAS